ncbi:MAG: hypothetical protein NZ605_04420 [Acidimicrobiales bacterium]|nr:hypothetical protein [Acidimicrobiales bacterium]
MGDKGEVDGPDAVVAAAAAQAEAIEAQPPVRVPADVTVAPPDLQGPVSLARTMDLFAFGTGGTARGQVVADIRIERRYAFRS